MGHHKKGRPHQSAAPRREGRSRVGNTAVIILVLLVVAGAAAAYLYVGKTGGSNAKLTAETLGKMQTEVGPGRVTVRFGTHVAARCDLKAGYSPGALEGAAGSDLYEAEKSAGTLHAFSLKGLKPGRLFYRVRILRPGGKPVDGPLENVVIPTAVAKGASGSGPVDGPATVAAATGGKGGTAGTTALTGGGTPSKGTGTGGSGTSSTGTGATGPGDTTASLAGGGTPGGTAAATSAGDGQAAQDEPKKLPYLPPIKGAPKTRGQRASMLAYNTSVKFGLASVPPKKREELMNYSDALRDEQLREPTAERAVEIGKTLMRLQQDMQANSYLKEALDMDPGKVEAHRLRLGIFRRYGMGWKIDETYQALLKLKPGDAEIQKDYARAKRIFGLHKTLDGPAKITTNDKYKGVMKTRPPTVVKKKGK